MADDNNNKRSFTGAIRRALSRFTASYRPPIGEQVRQAETGQAWFRDVAWEEFATKYLPGLGLGFSIHPERTTIVKDDNGIHIYTFAEMWDIYSKKYPIKNDVVKIDNIEKPIEYIELPRLRVFTVSYNGYKNKADWQEVRSIIRHYYKGRLVHLEQNIGETIVTPNHSLYNNAGKPVAADTNPDLLYIRQIPESVTIIDSYDLPIPYHTRTDNLGRVYKAKNNVKRHMNKEELLAFCRFLGAYVAEGCYWFYDGKRKGLVHISNNDVEWLKSIGRDAEKFMTKVKWRIDKQSTNKQSNLSTYCLSIRSSDLASILANMVGKGAANKRIPEFLFEAAKEYRDAFLTNYTIGDGRTVHHYTVNPIPKLNEGIYFNGATRSAKIAAGLSLLFALSGLDFSVKSYKNHHGNQMYEIRQIEHKHNFLNATKKMTFEDYEGYLFDISVLGDLTDKTQNFVDGIGLIVCHQTVYPYAAVWEKIWGAVPVEDYIKYKQLYDQEPFIRATIDIHTQIAVSGGFELDYPIDYVIQDMKDFFEQHDFFNQLKILVRDALLFGSSYAEIVRTWVCHRIGHDLNQLRVSYEEKFPKPVSVDGKPFEGFWWCFKPDTILLGDNKPINQYNVGNKVTGQNKLITVNEVMSRPYKGAMIKIKPHGMLPIEATPEHPLSVVSSITTNNRIIGFTNKQWKEIQHINVKKEGKNGDYVIIPRIEGTIDIKELDLRPYANDEQTLKVIAGLNKPLKLPLNEDIAWLLGLYVAEGSHDKQNISFSLNANETTLINKASSIIRTINYSPCVISRKHNNGIDVVFGSVLLTKALPEWCGTNSLNKKIPDFILYHKDLSLLKAFLDGYEAGDGYKRGNRIINVTVSKVLAMQLQLAYARLGYFASIEEKKYNYTFFDKRRNKLYKAHQKYEISYSTQAKSKAFITDKEIYVPIYKKEETYYEGNVYNVATDDHTYLVSNAIVHNCDRIDVAHKHNELYPDHQLENPYGEITRIKPLDPTYIRVRRDAYGTVLGYTQYYMFPLVTFLADEVMMLRYTPSSFVYESVYGTSMLRPILFHQELLKEYEQIVGQIMNVYLKPMFLVKLGNPNIPGADNITAEQYAAIARQFANRVPGRDIIVRQGSIISEIQPIQAPIQSLQTSEFWLTWLHNMRQYALNVPKFLIDPAGLNKATAQVVQEAYFTFINSLRQSISSQLIQFLFPKILYSLYGEAANKLIEEYGVPKIIWKPIKEESMADKAPLVIDLFRNNVIDLNEARNMLGLKPKESEEISSGALLPGRIIPAPASDGEGGGEEGTSIQDQISEQLQDEYLTDLSAPNQPSPGGGDTIQQSGANIPGGAPPPGTPALPMTEQKQILDTLDDLEDYADQLRRRLKRRH